MSAEVLTSRSNPLCVHVRKLASSRSYREKAGEFLCDSPKLLAEAVQWRAEIRTLLYTRGAQLPDIVPGGVRAVQVSESVMASVSPMQTPQGVVFTCPLFSNEPPVHWGDGGDACRLLLLDGVQDPGNVGTILRTADAFGWRVVLLDGCADLYNPKTVRAAMGVHFRSAVWRSTLDRAVSLVREGGLPVYATALRDDTRDLRGADLSRCAVIVGSEGRGVSPQALALCDETLKIPMTERCESLNAAVAAGIVLWEGWRGSLSSP